MKNILLLTCFIEYLALIVRRGVKFFRGEVRCFSPHEINPITGRIPGKKNPHRARTQSCKSISAIIGNLYQPGCSKPNQTARWIDWKFRCRSFRAAGIFFLSPEIIKISLDRCKLVIIDSKWKFLVEYLPLIIGQSIRSPLFPIRRTFVKFSKLGNSIFYLPCYIGTYD